MRLTRNVRRLLRSMIMILSLSMWSSCAGSRLQPVYVMNRDHMVMVPKGAHITWSTNSVITAHDGVFASHTWLEKVRQLQVEELEQ